MYLYIIYIVNMSVDTITMDDMPQNAANKTFSYLLWYQSIYLSRKKERKKEK